MSATPASRPKDLTGLATGAGAVLLGIAVIPSALGMPKIGPALPGPGLFPLLIGAFLILFGLIQIALSTVATRRGPRMPASTAALPVQPEVPAAEAVAEVSTDIGSDGPRRWINGGIVLAAIILFIVGSPVLGFPLTMFLGVTGIVASLRARWWVAVLTGAGSALGLWAMFEKALLVQLPDGFLPGF